ncbi:MAG: TRAM domain-containing protein, partial [Planctomycetota bacterium]
VGEYRELVARAREIIGDVAISSDFIVGFPGETEEDFQGTLDLVRDMEFQQSFMFTYSPREGTRAAEWEDDVPEEVKNERHRRLMEAQEVVDERRRSGLVGQTMDVMIHQLDDRNEGQVKGRTRGNDIVVLEGGEDLLGEICRVEITDATRLTLFGERVS